MCKACSGAPRHFTTLYKSANYIRKALSASDAGGSAKQKEWDAVAADLSNLLLLSYDKQRKEAIAEVIRAIKGSKAFSEADLAEMLQILRAFLSDGLLADVAPTLIEINEKAYQAGVLQVMNIVPVFNIVNPDALAWLNTHQIFWVKNYFDRRMAGEVAKAAAAVIEQGLSRDDAARFFLQQFKDKFDVTSYRYWDGFANHVVTRAREFGRVEGYLRAKAKYLRVVAILDHRTSEICTYMNNRIIPVSAAVDLRDKMMAAQNPEDVKKIAPFMKTEDVIGKSTSQLGKLSPGFALPPYHFDCRSRTVVFRPGKEIAPVKGDALSKDDKNLLSTYSDAEYSLHVDQAKAQKRFVYNENVRARHEKKLALLGLKTDAEISAFVKKQVGNAETVAAQAYERRGKDVAGKRDIQLVFFGNEAQIVVDLNYSVTSIQPYGAKWGGRDAQVVEFLKHQLWLKPI